MSYKQTYYVLEIVYNVNILGWTAYKWLKHRDQVIRDAVRNKRNKVLPLEQLQPGIFPYYRHEKPFQDISKGDSQIFVFCAEISKEHLTRQMLRKFVKDCPYAFYGMLQAPLCDKEDERVTLQIDSDEVKRQAQAQATAMKHRVERYLRERPGFIQDVCTYRTPSTEESHSPTAELTVTEEKTEEEMTCIPEKEYDSLFSSYCSDSLFDDINNPWWTEDLLGPQSPSLYPMMGYMD